MKSRLKKIALGLNENNDENISLEEAYTVVVKAISRMRSRTGDWAVRDDLKKFTSWGFYRGSELASIDEDAALDILSQLSEYVEEIKNNDSLLDVYEMVYRYASSF